MHASGETNPVVRSQLRMAEASVSLDEGTLNPSALYPEEGGVGEVRHGTDHGLLRMGGTGAVYGRDGQRGALRANAAVEECEEESPEGDVEVHRARI